MGVQQDGAQAVVELGGRINGVAHQVGGNIALLNELTHQLQLGQMRLGAVILGQVVHRTDGFQAVAVGRAAGSGPDQGIKAQRVAVQTGRQGIHVGIVGLDALQVGDHVLGGIRHGQVVLGAQIFAVDDAGVGSPGGFGSGHTVDVAVDLDLLPGLGGDSRLQLGVGVQQTLQLHKAALASPVHGSRPAGVEHQVNAVAGVHDDGVHLAGIPVQEADFQGQAILFSGVLVGGLDDVIIADGLAAQGDGDQVGHIVSGGEGHHADNHRQRQQERNDLLHTGEPPFSIYQRRLPPIAK